MHQSVRDAFVPFTERFEGRTDWFYLDLKGLVTIGYGNLVDPVGAAMALDFTSQQDGSAVAWSDVVSAWMAVKNHQGMRFLGGGAFRTLRQYARSNDGATSCTSRAASVVLPMPPMPRTATNRARSCRIHWVSSATS